MVGYLTDEPDAQKDIILTIDKKVLMWHTNTTMTKY